MTRQDSKKLILLLVLLAALGLTVVLSYRVTNPAAAAAVPSPETTKPSNPPASSDARIRMDLVEKPATAEEEIGRNNVFQYRQAVLPAAAKPLSSSTAPPSQPASVLAASGAAKPPVVIPAPPPIALKYQGFAVVNSATGGLTAFLSDDTRHYNVTVGEVMMGRYRIARISESAVEVEDLEYNRRQTLALLK